MKKLLSILVVILILLVLWSWYSSYHRSHPPQDYAYSFRADIDPHYYNSGALAEYYVTGYRVEAFAREIWQSKGLDLLNLGSGEEEGRTAQFVYLKLRAHADSLGAILSRSAALKKEGFNNRDIREMEANGYSPGYYRLLQDTGGQSLKQGDQNKAVWKMQGKLIELGFKMPHDGIFSSETLEAVKGFQEKNSLYPSGFADLETLEKIFTTK